LDGFTDLLWLFFILWMFITFIFPQIRYASLKSARASIISRLEKAFNAKMTLSPPLKAEFHCWVLSDTPP